MKFFRITTNFQPGVLEAGWGAGLNTPALAHTAVVFSPGPEDP